MPCRSSKVSVKPLKLPCSRKARSPSSMRAASLREACCAPPLRRDSASVYLSSYSFTRRSTFPSLTSPIVFTRSPIPYVDGVAEFQLCFHLIPFRDGYLAHVVAKADEAGALPVMPSCGGAGPGIETFDDLVVFPVTGDV